MEDRMASMRHVDMGQRTRRTLNRILRTFPGFRRRKVHVIWLA